MGAQPAGEADCQAIDPTASPSASIQTREPGAVYALGRPHAQLSDLPYQTIENRGSSRRPLAFESRVEKMHQGCYGVPPVPRETMAKPAMMTWSGIPRTLQRSFLRCSSGRLA